MGVPGGRNPRNLRQNDPAEILAEADRARKAVAAILRGMTYEQAAQVAGYADKSGAWKAVQRALEFTVAEIREDADLLRAKLVAQLDRAMVEITTIAFDRTAGVEVRLRYLEALRRNVESRAKITGALAPIQHEVITHDALDREIAELCQRFGLPIPGAASAPDLIGVGETPETDPAP